MHKLIDWISHNPRAIVLLLIAAFALLVLAACGPKPHPPIVYDDCINESGLILVIQTPAGALPMYGEIGCRCFVEVEGTTFVTSKTVDSDQCIPEENPDATQPRQIFDGFRSSITE